MDVRQIEIVWRHCVKVIIYDVQCEEKQFLISLQIEKCQKAKKAPKDQKTDEKYFWLEGDKIDTHRILWGLSIDSTSWEDYLAISINSNT